jgi:prolyl-tRNA synthetase
VALGEVVAHVSAALSADQQALLESARTFRAEHTVDVTTLADAIDAAQTGWARVPWSAVGVEGEAEANGKAVTVRCLTRPDGSVPESDDDPELVAILARAY